MEVDSLKNGGVNVAKRVTWGYGFITTYGFVG